MGDGGSSDGAVGIGPDVGLLAGGGHRLLEQPHLELHAQDPAHGVVDALLLDRPRLDSGLDGRDEAHVVGRHHDHVDAGVDSLLERRAVVPRHHLVDPAPVRQHEADEPELALEDVSDQVAVAMDLAGGRARVGHHHDPRAGVDRRAVRRQEELEQGGLVDLVDALVEQVRAVRPARRRAAERRPTIPDEVLGRCRRGVVGAQARPLESLDACRAERCDLVSAFAVAFECAAPANVLWDRHDRSEIPADPRRVHLGRRCRADLLCERGVVRRADPHVLRKHRGASHVVVAVHGVDAVQDRDPEARPECGVLVALDHVVPGLRRVGIRIAATAAQDRADVEGGRRPRIDRVLLDLCHLADLLVERHLAEQGTRALVNRFAGVHPGPARRWRAGCRRTRRLRARAGRRGRARGDRAAAGRNENEQDSCG